MAYGIFIDDKIHDLFFIKTMQKLLDFLDNEITLCYNFE